MADHDMILRRDAEGIAKRYKSYVKRTTRTRRKDLGQKRVQLQVRIAEMWKLLEILQDPKATPEEQAKVLTLCSVYGMTSMLEGTAFLADSVTKQLIRTERKDGKEHKIPVRVSVASATDDSAELLDVHVNIMNTMVCILRDLVMLHFDPKRVRDAWTDEHIGLRCPYLKEGDEDDTSPQDTDAAEAEEEATLDAADAERHQQIEKEEDDRLNRMSRSFLGRDFKKPEEKKREE